MDSNGNVLKRTIMIMLDLEGGHSIQKLREAYDPLVEKVAPHITLVFPFESDMSKFEIEKDIQLSLSGIRQFPIVIKDIERQDCWLFLKVAEGKESLFDIHQKLYGGKFKQYKPLWLQDYCPHVTVGHFDSISEAKEAYEKELNFKDVFQCVVKQVTVEIIGEDEKSIIESRYELEA